MKNKAKRIWKKITRALIGDPYYFIGGPLHGRQTRMDLQRYIALEPVEGRDIPHVYRFTYLVLEQGVAVAAFVSERMASEQAIAAYRQLQRVADAHSTSATQAPADRM